jgi:hypothetical protein
MYDEIADRAAPLLPYECAILGWGSAAGWNDEQLEEYNAELERIRNDPSEVYFLSDDDEESEEE